MDLSFIALVGLSLYSLFNSLTITLIDKELDDLKEKLNKVQKELNDMKKELQKSEKK